MSRLIDRAETFRGRIVESCLGLTKQSRLPQFVVRLEADECFDQETEQWVNWTQYEEREIFGRLTLSSKNDDILFHAENLHKAIGWSGQTLRELDETDYTGTVVQFRTDWNEYDGKTSIQIVNIMHADSDPTRRIARLEPEKVKALDARYANALRSKFGGPKPKKVSKPDSTSKETHSPASKPSKPAKSNKPKPKKKPGRPPKSEKPKPVGIAEHLGLPETCTEDEAWEQFNKHASDEFQPAEREAKWLDVIEEMGGADALDKENTWANIRDICLETMTDDPAL